ncbi:MAG: right-handed parallel beta-helix repeat-containing protein, partial [Bacteroidetes bacterium]|nr:right-handed parallel beta-helix repeat-containing protein [Bacteroidota bacterium]
IYRRDRAEASLFTGVFLTGSGVNTLIAFNKFHDDFISTSSTGQTTTIIRHEVGGTLGNEHKVFNNLVYNIRGGGDNIGFSSLLAGHIKYYHNTLVFDNPVPSNLKITRCIYNQGFLAVSGLDIKNNIFYITRAGTNTLNTALEFNSTTFPATPNHNIFYINGPGGYNRIGLWNNNNAPTLSDWQLLSGFDQSSLNINPFSIITGSGNHAPSNASVKGAGTALGITTDIHGASRNLLTPDPGAIEMNAFAIDAGISLMKNPVSVLPQPGIENIEVQIYNFGSTVINSATVSGFITNGSIIFPVAPFSYSGILQPSDTVNLNLGTYNFTAGSHKIVLWISNPNNSGADSNPYNDTLKMDVCVNLNGTYSIGLGGDFLNFTAAINSLSCGISGPVTFNVIPNSGPYKEKIYLSNINTNSINKITFNGNGNTLIKDSTIFNDAVIVLDGADYITFNDFVIKNQDINAGSGVIMTREADNNTINNCTIDLSGVYSSTSSFGGVMISGNILSPETNGISGNGNTISNTTIDGGQYGVILSGYSSGSHAFSIAVINCNIKNYLRYGVYLINVSNSTISKNVISSPSRMNSTFNVGIYAGGNGSNNLIESNRIDLKSPKLFGVFGSIGIQQNSFNGTTGAPNLFVNNLIFNYSGGYGDQTGIRINSGMHSHFLHNTVAFLDPNPGQIGLTRGFENFHGMGMVFKNNVISVSRGGTGLKYCLYNTDTNFPIQSDHNVLYNTSSNFIFHNSTSINSLTQWKTVNSGFYDQSSVSLNPFFSNPSLGIFALTNPVANNIGAPLMVATDIVGVNRSATTPDPGAYEFNYATDDAGISGFTNPLQGNLYPGQDSVKVTLFNYGVNNLNTVTVSGYITNGTIIHHFTPVNYSGPTVTYNMGVTVNLGAFNFAAGPYTIVAWTSNPNNLTDVNAFNDTLKVTVCLNFSGTYSIGAGGDFSTIQSAINALECGVSGPVVFEIMPGSG